MSKSKRYKKKAELIQQISTVLDTTQKLNDLREREIELSHLMLEQLHTLSEMIADEQDE